MIDNTGKIVNRFESIAEAGRITGIERRNIEKVIKGERLKAGGYRWIQESEVMPNAETVNY